MSEEKQRTNGLRTIYTESQREWLKTMSGEFTSRELQFIMNCDNDAVVRLKTRCKYTLHIGVPAHTNGDLIRYRHEFEQMDWNRNAPSSKIRKTAHDERMSAKYNKLLKAAMKHDPNEVQERLRLNGMYITWGEYAKRISMLLNDGR